MACNFFNNLFSTCLAIDDDWRNRPLHEWNADDVRNFLRAEGYEDWEVHFSRYNGRNLVERLTEGNIVQEINLDPYRARDLIGLINRYRSQDVPAIPPVVTVPPVTQVQPPDGGGGVNDGGLDGPSALVVFNDVSDNQCEITRVLRGEYIMFEVMKAKNADKDGMHLCYVKRIPPSYNGSCRVGGIIHIHATRFHQPVWYDHQDIDVYIRQSEDALKHFRIASWNVRCATQMGNAPNKTELHNRMRALADVICRSECDIVALQELPSIINKNKKGMPPIFWFETEEILLDELQQLSLEEWGSEANEVFYDDPNGPQGPNRNIHTFIYKKSRVRCSGSNRILDPTHRNQVLQRTPVLGYFHNIRFPDSGNFTLCNLHLQPTNAKEEVQRIGNLIELIEREHSIGELIFLGDFNLSSQTPRSFRIGSEVTYMKGGIQRTGIVKEDKPARAATCEVSHELNDIQKVNKKRDDPAQLHYTDENEQDFFQIKYGGNSINVDENKFKPTPDEETWDKFIKFKYIPCIQDVFTNAVMDSSYDNIWIKRTLDYHRPSLNDESERKIITNVNRLALSDVDMNGLKLNPFENFRRGVFEHKEILLPGQHVITGGGVSDHNLVFMDVTLMEDVKSDIEVNVVPSVPPPSPPPSPPHTPGPDPPPSSSTSGKKKSPPTASGGKKGSPPTSK